MLSPAMVHLIDRARLRLGFDVEILNTQLQPVYESGAAYLGRAIAGSPDLAAELHDVLRHGARRTVQWAGCQYRLVPVRERSHRERNGAIIAVKHATENGEDAARWADLVHAIVEAERSVRGASEEALDLNRRLTACLRFVQHLSQLDDTAEVAEALVQAVAVWFDADARVYCRGFDGDYVLYACLAGVARDERTSHLLESELAAEADLLEAGARREPSPGCRAGTVSLPLRGGAQDSGWIMRVAGDLPPGSDLLLTTIARVAGLQLEHIERRHESALRARLEQVLSDPAVPEHTADLLLRELVSFSNASGGALTLSDREGSRCLARAGDAAPPGGGGHADDAVSGAAAVRLPVALPGGVAGALELRARPDAPLGRDALLSLRVAVPVLRAWLTTAAPVLAASDLLARRRGEDPSFEQRIAEELARAKRFDLGLALVLVDVGEAGRAGLLETALREELRGSDVLGTLSERHVVALLTHTDVDGLERVVQRLRVRLAAAAEELKVPGLTCGKAAFSPNCRTPQELLAEALTRSEPIIVH